MQGKHIQERGFDSRQYYRDLVLELLHEHEPVGRKKVEGVLMTKLPARLTKQQKCSRIRNILQSF